MRYWQPNGMEYGYPNEQHMKQFYHCTVCSMRYYTAHITDDGKENVSTFLHQMYSTLSYSQMAYVQLKTRGPECIVCTILEFVRAGGRKISKQYKGKSKPVTDKTLEPAQWIHHKFVTYIYIQLLLYSCFCLFYFGHLCHCSGILAQWLLVTVLYNVSCNGFIRTVLCGAFLHVTSCKFLKKLATNIHV